MQPKFPKSSHSFIHKFSHKWIWVRKNECFTKFNQLNFKNFSDRNFFWNIQMIWMIYTEPFPTR